MAEQVVINAKTQRPSVCNAIETVLIHKGWAEEHTKALLQKLEEAGVEIRGDEAVCTMLPSAVDIFRRSQRFKAHRPPCVKLLRADADFGAVAEFKAVCKTC